VRIFAIIIANTGIPKTKRIYAAGSGREAAATLIGFIKI
jgi:hypothetical protein